MRWSPRKTCKSGSGRDDTYVDFDRSLATAVNKVRQALADSAIRPRFVETVPKRGYRFIYPVGTLSAPADGGDPKPDGGLTGERTRGVLWAVLGLACAILVWLWLKPPDTRPATFAGQPPKAMPLTSYPGIEHFTELLPRWQPSRL